jgi:hypothetical protein
MQAAVNLILLLSMLAHGASGCCWHHAHAPRDVGAASAAHPHLCHCAEEHGQSCEENGEHHRQTPQSDECDEGECVFVRPATSDVVNADSSASAAVVDCYDIAILPYVDHPMLSRTARDEYRRGLSPPLRAHLLLSVLLI